MVSLQGQLWFWWARENSYEKARCFGPKEYLSNFEGGSFEMCRLVLNPVRVFIQPQDCFDKTIFGFSSFFSSG